MAPVRYTCGAVAEDLMGDDDCKTLAAPIYGCAMAPVRCTCGAVAEDLLGDDDS